MPPLIDPSVPQLRGKRVAVVVFSHYPSDPRPRRAAEALAQEGAEVEVISLRQNQGDRFRESFNGVKILRVPLKHRRGGKFTYVFNYAAFISIAFLLLAWRSLTRRYRLVHVHNMPDVLVFSALIPKACGAKVILDLHDPMPELMMTIFGLGREQFSVRLLRLLEKASTGFADLVITPNLSFEKLFASRSCRVNKLRVVMNSPDEGIFKYREAAPPPCHCDPSKPFVIMHHGALVERHGLDLAVSALARFRSSVSPIELRIYGRRTSFLDRVLQTARELGLQDQVKYFGAMRLEQIVDAIDACDVGIVPNRRSLFTELNMPTRIFEYLSRGKAVIAPRTTGIQDYFKEDEMIFFDLGNPDDLADRIRYVATHPGEVKETIRRGQAVYLAHRWSAERSRFVSLAGRVLTGVPITAPAQEWSAV